MRVAPEFFEKRRTAFLTALLRGFIPTHKLACRVFLTAVVYAPFFRLPRNYARAAQREPVLDLDVWLDRQIRSFTGSIGYWMILGGKININEYTILRDSKDESEEA